METRSQAARLDPHDKQINKIQSDILEIKASMDAERLEEREFRKFVISWIKRQEKQPVVSPSRTENSQLEHQGISGTLFNSGGRGAHIPIAPVPHDNSQLEELVSRSEASPVISTASVIAKLEELISKSEARSSLFAKLEPSPSSEQLPPASDCSSGSISPKLSGSFFKSGGSGSEFLANAYEKKLRSSSGALSHTEIRFQVESGYSLGRFEGKTSPNSFQPTIQSQIQFSTLGLFEENKGPISFQPNVTFQILLSRVGLFEGNKDLISVKPNVQFHITLSTLGCFERIKGPSSLKPNVNQKIIMGLIFSDLELCKKGKAPFDRGKDSLSHCPLNGSRLTFSVTWHLWVVHGQPRPPEDAIEEAFTWMSSQLDK